MRDPVIAANRLFSQFSSPRLADLISNPEPNKLKKFLIVTLVTQELNVNINLMIWLEQRRTSLKLPSTRVLQIHLELSRRYLAPLVKPRKLLNPLRMKRSFPQLNIAHQCLRQITNCNKNLLYFSNYLDFSFFFLLGVMHLAFLLLFQFAFFFWIWSCCIIQCEL